MFKEQDKIRIKSIEDEEEWKDDPLMYQVGDTGVVLVAGFTAEVIGMYTVQFDNGKILGVFEEDMELVTESTHVGVFRKILKEVISGKEKEEILVDYYKNSCRLQYEFGLDDSKDAL